MCIRDRWTKVKVRGYAMIYNSLGWGVGGRPNWAGAYQMGSDGAAGGPTGAPWVPTGPRRAHVAAVACPGVPYINRAPMRDSRATRRAQNRVPTETHRNPIWPEVTRRAPTDHSTVPSNCVSTDNSDLKAKLAPSRFYLLPLNWIRWFRSPWDSS